MPHRAAQALIDARKQPQALPWAAWAEVRAWAPAQGYQWPAHCYLPQGALTGALRAQGVAIDHPDQADLAQWLALQSVLAAWRPTQGIYRYDPDVGMALACSPLAGAIPAAALRRLPEWAVYLEIDPAWLPIPGLGPIHGLWATLDWHSQAGDELRLVLDLDQGPAWAALPLAEGQTLAAAIEAQQDQLLRAVAAGDAIAPGLLQGADRAEGQRRLFSGALSLLLYLCAEPELYGQRSAATAPPRQRPPPRQTKAGPRDPDPPAPEVWEVAYHLGRRIRDGRELARAHDAEGRAGPRPHIRRAHWHGFWEGAGEARTLRPRWLPPIPVAADDPDAADRPTIRRVQP